MHPLVSHFPSARPGWGLLTLRLVLTGFLLLDTRPAIDAASAGHTPNLTLTVLLALLIFLTAMCVAFGLLTPITHTFVIILELALLSRGSWAPQDLILVSQTWHARVCQAAIALAVALIGPGAYSLDAKLFGRREIYIPARNPNRH